MDARGNLFGITTDGGPKIGNDQSEGTVFEFIWNGQSYDSEPIILADFHELLNKTGIGPTSLTIDSAGNLYGTAGGGTGGSGGEVFEIPKISSGYGALQTVATLNYNINGSAPSHLVIDNRNGDLFGLTYGGPNNDVNGSVFEVVKNGATYSPVTTLVTFNDKNGYEPNSLAIDKGGVLFGTTLGGGPYEEGEVFQVKNGILTVLDGFKNTNEGRTPDYVIVDGNDDLYGATLYGGTASDHGVVFELPPSSAGGYASDHNVLHNYDGSKPEGGSPNYILPYQTGDVLFIASGGYGPTSGGAVTEIGGIKFQLTPTTPSTVTPTRPPSGTPLDPSVTTLPAATHFTITDTTTGTTSDSDGNPYTGPVAGIQNEYINITPDSLNIAAITPNVYIHTGDGNDGINVSSRGGNNVLDGEGGSNFLVGGSGNDTFLVNDLNAKVPSWTTMEGFHTGDAATIWGLTPKDFQLAWLDGGGATGHTGLTLYATSAGKPEIAVTIAGASIADISGGRLAVQFGTVNSMNYMEINRLG